jgi:hypothetical protein
MKPLHQSVRDLLLWGKTIHRSAAPIAVPPPPALDSLLAAVRPAQQDFNERAIVFGHRYRSAFWALYLLASLAVLCAAMPYVLGWADEKSARHALTIWWGMGEFLIIAGVALVYFAGHRQDWQGRWLALRTRAELSWYLPMLAPLLPVSPGPSAARNWYARVFGEGGLSESDEAIEALCAACEPRALEVVGTAWNDDAFVQRYGAWCRSIIDEQVHYHRHVAALNRALRHRAHQITTTLFVLTGLGAALHLVWHANVLLLLTMWFPALGASLHGAIAQSEAYRLVVSAERLEFELGAHLSAIDAALAQSSSAECAIALRAAVKATLATILDEHEDWLMLVRPHHLPLG